MSQTQTVHTGIDTYVGEVSPNLNHGQDLYLSLRGDVGQRRRAYLWFSLPFAPNDTIISAIIHLEPRSGFAASPTITAKRITGPRTWRENVETWGTAVTGANPLVTTATNQAQVINQPFAPFDLDVTAMLNNVSNGGKWFGVELSTGDANINNIHSSESEVYKARPTLTITWAKTPKAPTDLKPSGGSSVSVPEPVLKWSFVDQNGADKQAAFQVQVDPTNTNWGSPNFDSGKITTPDEMIDLSDPTYPFSALSEGNQRYWRVRAQTDAAIWSDWSDGQLFQYNAPPNVTINNPPASPNNSVAETTPPIDWTSGGVQKVYEVILYEGQTETSYGYDWGSVYGGYVYDQIWTSGRVKSTDTRRTLPPHLLTGYNGSRYKIEVRVWDGIDRQGLPGAPTYGVATRVFTLVETPAVAKVTNLIASQGDGYVALDWDRSAGQPDRWALTMNGDIVDDTVLGDEPWVSGIHYSYRFPKPKPLVNATYGVRAIVNNGGVLQHSQEVTVVYKYLLTGIWIQQVNTKNTHRFKLIDAQEIAVGIGWNSTIQYPIGDRRPRQVRDNQRGYEGTIQGIIVGLPDKAEAERIAGNPPDTRYRIDAYDMSFFVEIAAISQLEPIVGMVDGLPAWQFTFDCYEVGPAWSFNTRG